MHVLYFLTDFGDPFLTVPLALIVQCWLVATRQWRVARCWAAGFTCSAGIVVLTKFAYAGWDIGVTALHFTGVSGHTMLSAATYPLIASIFVNRTNSVTFRRAILAGIAFALVIGVSRVAGGYHSWSEVVSGWLLGGSVALLTLHVASRQQSAPYLHVGSEPVDRNGISRFCSPSANRLQSEQYEHTDSAAIPLFGKGIFTAALIAIIFLCHGHVAPVSAWIFGVAPKVAKWASLI
jgi:membrane-associated phospholipid phosphatase